MMDGVNKGSFCGGIPGKEQGLSLKDYYLIKSQVMRRYRSNKLMEEYDENLLGGLRHDIYEMRQVLNFFTNQRGCCSLIANSLALLPVGIAYFSGWRIKLRKTPFTNFAEP